MSFFESIILGAIEGFSEFLPISSTGHLIIFSDFLNIVESEFVKSFQIIIQLGAILAVLFLYWRSFLVVENIKKLFVAFLPTGIIGLLLYKTVKSYFLGNEQIVLTALLVGGFVIIIFEIIYNKFYFKESLVEENLTLENISYKQSFFIGLFQSLSIIPGVSRSAATILGGLSLGLKRRVIVEFSFLLALPTMLAASGLEVVKNVDYFSFEQFEILITGFLISFVVAVFSIKFLLRFVERRSFVIFGLYRIILVLIIWLFL